MPDVNAKSENDDDGIYAPAGVFSICDTPYFRADIETVSKQKKSVSGMAHGAPSVQETTASIV
jgi:hypothetical protein